jgi:spermidine synthase
MTGTRHPSALPIATVCFFLSGVAALLYEVVWMRFLAVSFGHTVYAVTTVLAAYMGGLALGSVAAGRWADGLRRPLRTYGILEAAIGVYCALSPFLFGAIEGFHLRVQQALQPGTVESGAFQFLLAGAVLLPPTALMGATLPVLTRAVVETSRSAAAKVGTLYAVNTWGAVVGTAATGYLMLPWLGLRMTVWVGVGLNFSIAALALNRAARTPALLPAAPMEPGPRAKEGEPPGRSRARTAVALVAIGVSGASAMAYEIAWTRALSLTLGSSTYSFTAMLTTFLAGLALGALAISRLLRHRVFGLAAFGIVQIAIAFVALAILPAFGRLPDLMLHVLARTGVSHATVLASGLVLSFLLMIVPTVLIGATFPLLVSILQRGVDRIGHDVGVVYGSNTVGTILGAALAGVVLIPRLGIQNTVVAAAGANLLAGLAVVAIASGTGRRLRLATLSAALATALLAVVVPHWDPQKMTTGVAVYAESMIREPARGLSQEVSRLLFYREGVSTTVAVKRTPVATILSVNGKTDASNGFDMATQILSGHLGPLLQPQARRALVIGLASGVTVGAMAQHPFEVIDVAEIEPAMVEASRFFTTENRNALADRRVRVRKGDGRFILASASQPYDVIVSEPSNPWIAGVASLFTRDFYEAARRHLSARGVMVQWVGGYAMSRQDMQMVARTFQEVFPHVSVWAASPNDFLLVATPETVRIDLGAIRERLAQSPGVAEDFDRYRWRGANLALRFFLAEDDLRRFSQGAPLNTDDLPLLEFSAPLALYSDTARDNGAAMRAFRREERPRVEGLGPEAFTGDRARLHAAWEQWHSGNYDEASHHLSRVGAPEGLERDLRVERARALFVLGRFDEALDEFNLLSAGLPSDAVARRYVKGISALKGIEVARSLAEKTKDGQAMQIALGEIFHDFARQGRDRDFFLLALEQLSAAVHVYPGTYDLLNNYAGVQLETGDPDGAIGTIQRAVALNPEVPSMHFNLGVLLETRGRSSEAVRAYGEAVRLAPGWTKPAERMSSLLAKDVGKAK